MKKVVFTISTATVIAFTGAFNINTAYAKTDDIKEIQTERKEVKTKLSKAEKEISQLLKEVKEINQQLEDLNETLAANNEEMDKTKSEIKELEDEIDLIEKEIEERFNILKERARSYQQNGGDIAYLDVLLGSQDFNEFISRSSAVNKITDSDAELIEQQEKDKAKVEKKLSEVNELKQELEAIEQTINEQKEAAEENKKELKDKEEKLQEKVSKLEIKDGKLAELEAEAIAEMSAVPLTATDSSNNQANVSGGGILGWPTDGGYISSPMGPRNGRMHKGIDIARTDRSTSPPIYAADSGIVISAGSDGAYGNKVVIDHNNGMQTIYAHLSSIDVKPGQSVSKGSRLGVMGTTGRSTGIHLHFEVHVNGSLQNPMSYLK